MPADTIHSSYLSQVNSPFAQLGPGSCWSPCCPSIEGPSEEKVEPKETKEDEKQRSSNRAAHDEALHILDFLTGIPFCYYLTWCDIQRQDEYSQWRSFSCLHRGVGKSLSGNKVR